MLTIQQSPFFSKWLQHYNKIQEWFQAPTIIINQNVTNLTSNVKSNRLCFSQITPRYITSECPPGACQKMKYILKYSIKEWI